MNAVDGLGAGSNPLLGRVLDDRYRVGRAIGKGGMGVVYEAQHLLIGRKVALKTMAAHTSFSSAAVERFRREAQAAASVGNSHIVDVLDMGQLDAGSLYIVLEHLNGVDLGFAVASEGKFQLARAVDIASQLCDALSAVHAAGIVHRDLKPDNVFLTVRDGRPDFVKVLDFGVCKFQESDGVQLTVSGERLGTPQFMAPEQVAGSRDIDHRTDIHALGAILFFVLTGRPPFDAGTLPSLYAQICTQTVPSIRSVDPSLPAELDAVIQRALQKKPEHRFDSCQALKAAMLLASSRAGSSRPAATTWPALIEQTQRAPRGETASLVRALKLRRLRPVSKGLVAVAVVVGVPLGSILALQAPPLESGFEVHSPPAVASDEASPGANEVPVVRSSNAVPPKPLSAGLPEALEGPRVTPTQRASSSLPRAADSREPRVNREAPVKTDTKERESAKMPLTGNGPVSPIPDPPATKPASNRELPENGLPAARATDPTLLRPDLPLNRGPKRGL
jgi:serine/threonine protein kinase